MTANREINELIDQVSRLRDSAKEYTERYRTEIENAHAKNQVSAVNLAHYLGIRNHDLRALQESLHGLGVSTLVGTESHALAGLESVSKVLHGLKGTAYRNRKVLISADKGHKQIRKNTNRLLGKKLKGSVTRIMVTLASEAASDQDLVHDLVTTGMSVARINCAHDGPGVWERMIANVAKARARTGRNCKIAMDLAGPKLRTGAIQPGPCVVRLRPRRDVLGRIVHCPRVALGPQERATTSDGDWTFLPVAEDWNRQLREGDTVSFQDTRDKRCTLTVESIDDDVAWANCDKSAYILSGTQLELERADAEPAIRHGTVGDLPATEQAIILARGDTLILTRDQNPGAPAEQDASGRTVAPAFLPCTLPEVFGEVAVGEPVSFDDGRIDGVIKSVDEDRIAVAISYARGGAARLRSDKGVNFPRSRLGLSGLTQKDKEDLKFVVQHADIVNLSFVNRREDVRDLLWELDRLGADKLGVIVKIETMSGFHNLPLILLEALKHRPVGVMIARGDLAVEAGWKNLAKIQEEIMWMCEAAHIPIVWATQVLENLAKQGTPSRAEIADVVMAQRTECVMLNKGPHILETVRLLDLIIQSMEDHWGHDAPTWPALELTEDWANISYTSPGCGIAKLDLKSTKDKRKKGKKAR
jgi:pyruvate kinase